METGAVRFTRAPDTGREVAVVGAGPAETACAHRLALAGHRVTLFDARPKGGGLNEYGIAAYKTVDDFAQREVSGCCRWAASRCKPASRWAATSRSTRCASIRRGVSRDGNGGVRALSIDGEQLNGVMNAVDFIVLVRQADALENVAVGRRVVVIGGGNTAIDAAVQSRKLGAERVTMVYRRGVEAMSATWAEREFAQKSGVTLVTHAKPVRMAGRTGR